MMLDSSVCCVHAGPGALRARPPEGGGGTPAWNALCTPGTAGGAGAAPAWYGAQGGRARLPRRRREGSVNTGPCPAGVQSLAALG